MHKHILKLSAEEREELWELVKKGKGSSYKLTRALILLAADEGEYSPSKKTDEVIAAELNVSISAVHRARQQCVEEGIDATLTRRVYSRSTPLKISGEEEAQLIAISCSSPPTGRCRWTLKLLADRMVAIEVVDSVSASTVGRALKKTN